MADGVSRAQPTRTIGIISITAPLRHNAMAAPRQCATAPLHLGVPHCATAPLTAPLRHSLRHSLRHCAIAPSRHCATAPQRPSATMLLRHPLRHCAANCATHCATAPLRHCATAPLRLCVIQSATAPIAPLRRGPTNRVRVGRPLPTVSVKTSAKAFAHTAATTLAKSWK